MPVMGIAVVPLTEMVGTLCADIDRRCGPGTDKYLAHQARTLGGCSDNNWRGLNPRRFL